MLARGALMDRVEGARCRDGGRELLVKGINSKSDEKKSLVLLVSVT